MNEHQKKIQSEQNVARFRAISESMANLYEKDTDYANSFCDTYQRIGMISAVTRIQEKCNRLCNLAVHQGQQQINNESIQYTLVYLANDAVMTIVEIINAMDAQNKSITQSEQNVARFRAITESMANLYEKKNADYGNSFGDTYQRLGMISAVTRIQDKCNRLCNLAVHQGQQQVKDESIRDTLVDLANYAIMTLIELEREDEAKSLIPNPLSLIPNN